MSYATHLSAIVDKTAAFVARNGIDFENKIREKESGNPRFNFLSQTDPYNAYYQHKVSILSQNISEIEENRSGSGAPRRESSGAVDSKAAASRRHQAARATTRIYPP